MDRFVIRKRKHEEIGEEKHNEKTCRMSMQEDSPTGVSDCAKTSMNDSSVKFDTTKPLHDRHTKEKLRWRKLHGENLNCDYCVLFNKKTADELLTECEQSLQYNEGQLARVQIFGKWHDIPRKQVAHGDIGLSYKFSNNTVPARPWVPFLERVRDQITEATGYAFNFVLINRYNDGNDHMGEHRDDEKDLVSGYPIASLSLGQPRDFIFKHADARGKGAKRRIDPVKLELEHGSLLMMKHPTNVYWYHALPPRKRAPNVRINMTFRKMAV